MATPVEKLLALKAFYLGHAAAEKAASRPTAIAMVTAAIEQLSTLADRTSAIRRAFYHLLRAEILRHGGDPVPDRHSAQQLCTQINSSLYEVFMHVEQATMTTKKACGIQTLYAQDEGIKRTQTNVVVNGFQASVFTYDLACRAIGVDERSFTEREFHFLRKTTIKDMLDKLGVNYAP
jgi:alkylhydroperoxidase family enzyme